MPDYSYFQKSLRHLELQLGNLRGLDPSLPVLMKEAVQESVIQRFETCYDCAWKVLKRHLAEVLGLPDLPASPKPVLKIAASNGLLDGRIEEWLGYADARIATSHDYSGEKAELVLKLAPAYVIAAIALYQQLTGETWH